MTGEGLRDEQAGLAAVGNDGGLCAPNRPGLIGDGNGDIAYAAYVFGVLRALPS